MKGSKTGPVRWLALFCWVVLAGCGSDGLETTVESIELQGVCEPGATEVCTCEGELVGAAICLDDGSGFGECACVENGSVSSAGDGSDLDCDTVSVEVTAPTLEEGFPEDGLDQLVGFLFQADLYPPQGPPQGGWDTYDDPGLEPGGTVTIEITGATIGRTSCLEGDYYVYVTAVEDASAGNMMSADWNADTERPIPLGGGDISVSVTLKAFECPLGQECP